LLPSPPSLWLAAQQDISTKTIALNLQALIALLFVRRLANYRAIVGSLFVMG